MSLEKYLPTDPDAAAAPTTNRTKLWVMLFIIAFIISMILLRIYGALDKSPLMEPVSPQNKPAANVALPATNAP